MCLLCYVYLIKIKYKSNLLIIFSSIKLKLKINLRERLRLSSLSKGVNTLLINWFNIIHEENLRYSPQSNNVVERKNRTLVDMIKCKLPSSGLTKRWSGEAILAYCFILNRVPFNKPDKTLYELWKSGMPNINFFRICGVLSRLMFQKSRK